MSIHVSKPFSRVNKQGVTPVFFHPYNIMLHTPKGSSLYL